MTELSLKDLDPRLQKQVQAADQSIHSGNPNYAIEVCAGILKQNPGCVDVRRIMRKAQNKLAASKSKGSRMFSGVTNAPFMVKASNQIKKDPMAAIETAEKMLKVNPANIPALKLLGQAAEAVEMKQTSIFAYECIRDIDPKNVENLLALGEAYLDANQVDDCIKASDLILKVSPGNGEASDLIRRASVKQSLEEGKWEQDDTDFRDKLRDEDQAVKLEQKSRNINDEGTLHSLIQEVYAKIEAEPEDMNNYQQIAGYYRKLNDFESAIQWIAYARTLPAGQADTSLETLEAEYYVDQIEFAIQAKTDELAADPDNATIQAEIDAHKQQLHDYQLEQAKSLVERYPNDYNHRFDLGQLLYDDGRYDEAMQQFQLSQRNPKVRTKSLLYMGMALKDSNKFDLAVDQLKTLKDELQVMDDTKKSTIYELAQAYESMNDEANAISQYKELYQNDIGYRDVADKINAFYNKQSS